MTASPPPAHPTVPDVRIAHTAQLTAEELRAVRAFLHDAFDGDFSDGDWEHTVGGMHALVTDARGVAAHGSVIQRRVLHAGRSLRVGYVEGVAVRADVRRRGLGGRVMAALEEVVARSYACGALSASDAGAALYEQRGWQVWPGALGVLGPNGEERLPEEEGTTYVWAAPDADPGHRVPDPAHPLLFDWRDGDVL
ncbi:GNAT family N-acetyltransferase [Streptomyces sp. NPDC059578]|uniref:GNAT family N-acetyltransferase n=1 Tax=unclassified Streptomyces TaxID=2593676 RepID=UPI0036629429